MKNNKILNQTRHGNGTRLDTQRNQFASENMKKKQIGLKFENQFLELHNFHKKNRN